MAIKLEDLAMSEDAEWVYATTRVVYWSDKSRGCVHICDMDTDGHIETLATTVYELSKSRGGTIPYTIIRELAENFLHAGFRHPAVFVTPDGCGAAFLDCGPGLSDEIDPYEPGASTADETVAKHIRGLGSGLSIVRDWTVEDDSRAFWHDPDRKCGFAVFVSDGDGARRACLAIQAMAAIAEELGSPDDVVLGGNTQPYACAVTYVLDRATALTEAQIERLLTGRATASGSRDGGVVKFALRDAEVRMAANEPYRDAIEAACSRIAASDMSEASF